MKNSVNVHIETNGFEIVKVFFSYHLVPLELIGQLGQHAQPGQP